MEFQLTDNIFAKARRVLDSFHVTYRAGLTVHAARQQAVLQGTQSVCLWLGANVMLEYSLDEAREVCAGVAAGSRCSHLCRHAALGTRAAGTQLSQRAEQPG